MISSTGVIYQYFDGPALPSPVLIDAYIPHTVASPSRIALRRTLFGLVTGSIVGMAILVSPLLFIEAWYRLSQVQPQTPQEQTQQALIGAQPYTTPAPRTIVSAYNIDLTPTVTPVQQPDFGVPLTEGQIHVLNPVNTNFSVIIPKIGVNSAIIAGVDAGNETEYKQALARGVAHAKGTYYPGQNGTSYIFAHSTDYPWNVNRFNAVFYLLREMVSDDRIYIVYNNTLFEYAVTEVRIVDPGETFYLKPRYGQEELILQTCWPPGTVDKRLLVIARPNITL